MAPFFILCVRHHSSYDAVDHTLREIIAMRKKLLLVIMVLCSGLLFAQELPLRISLRMVEIDGLPGFQSYAWATHEGQWLIVGGRRDGLHRRQPFAAFDPIGENAALFVVDPSAKQWWSSPATDLPVELQEQLRSTNMVFQQEGKWLHLAGGYGYSPSQGDHITHSLWTVLDVPGIIEAVKQGSSMIPFVRSVDSPAFAVTGGHMDRVDGLFYVVGGQYFEGRYNPMGPDHGPGFIQKYTNAIRRFSVDVDDQVFKVELVSETIDSAALHRRDYNVVASILPDGREGLTAFSGVFRPDVDVPFLDCVHIDSGGYQVQPGFSQYYNHYHCATLPLYSEVEQSMHTIFFGGIAQYYDSLGILVQDDAVPFVRSIARVSRSADGQMGEYLLPVQMPALLGAGSELIPSPGVPRYSNGVVRFDDLQQDSVLVGHILGGIESSEPNIFFVNTGGESWASKAVFEVWVHPGEGTGTDELNPQSRGTLGLQVLPNPSDGDFAVRFHLVRPAEVRLTITDLQGITVFQDLLEGAVSGSNTFAIALNRFSGQGIFYVTLDAGYEKAVQKVILNP